MGNVSGCKWDFWCVAANGAKVMCLLMAQRWMAANCHKVGWPQRGPKLGGRKGDQSWVALNRTNGGWLRRGPKVCG
jgi:hypothetical protein